VKRTIDEKSNMGPGAGAFHAPYARACIALFWIMAGEAACAGDARNLLDNGGFECWGELPAAVARQAAVANVRLIPDMAAPVGWTPMREVSRNKELTGVVARDERVKHSGDRSVRLENRDMRDITCVQYSTEPFARPPAGRPS
jgi:hypothetical protein